MCIGPKSDVSEQASGIVAEGCATKETNRKIPINNVDFEQPRREHLFDMPQFLRDWVTTNLLRQKDAKNLGIFLVGLNIALTSFPCAASIFYLDYANEVPKLLLFLAGMVYAVFHLKTYGRSFMLALHYITHCSIYNRRFRFLDSSFTVWLGFLFVIPPGLYYPHHVGMHHAQDNLAPLDMSSTMDYSRGSQWDHFKYMLRFVTIGSFELPFRLMQAGKYSLAARCIVGCSIYWSIVILGFATLPVATFTVVWFPWIVMSFSLMQGNFKEHVFVDPDDPENNYKSAFTCINAPSNALTFNTGYHIEHHEEPGLPWFKLPELFLKNIDKHAENDSLTFSGIGSMEVGSLVLKGEFETLADHYINIGQPKRTRGELIREFKRRLTPIFPSLVKPTSK